MTILKSVVAPYTGAWIETDTVPDNLFAISLPLTQGHGLKRLLGRLTRDVDMLPLTQGHGLKRKLYYLQ